MNKYALLMAFEYKSSSFPDEFVPVNPPSYLLDIRIDLRKAYINCVENFGISPANITIVTDTKVSAHEENPWTPDESTRYIELDYPVCRRTVREICQFIENTTKGIVDTIFKGGDSPEIFLYYTGHGIAIKKKDDSEDDAIMLMGTSGKQLRRHCIPSKTLFKILFGKYDINEDGEVDVDLIEVDISPGSRIGSVVYKYRDFQHKCLLTPAGEGGRTSYNCPEEREESAAAASSRESYSNRSERGVCANAGILAVFDCCCSGEILSLKFEYDPLKKIMKNDANCSPTEYPYCVALSATNKKNAAGSMHGGSPFTRCLIDIFRSSPCGISIRGFHETLTKKASSLVLIPYPTVSSTRKNQDNIMPFFAELKPCDVNP